MTWALPLQFDTQLVKTAKVTFRINCLKHAIETKPDTLKRIITVGFDTVESNPRYIVACASVLPKTSSHIPDN